MWGQALPLCSWEAVSHLEELPRMGMSPEELKSPENPKEGLRGGGPLGQTQHSHSRGCVQRPHQGCTVTHTILHPPGPRKQPRNSVTNAGTLATLGSLLLVHGCMVFLVTDLEPSLALASALRSRALPQQHGLIPPSHPFLPRLLAKEEACCKRQTEAGKQRGSHAIPTPSASRRQRPCQRLAEKLTSYFPHHVPDALSSSHSQNKALHFLSAVNGKAKVEKLKKERKESSIFVLEKSVMDSKESRGEGRGFKGRSWGNSTLAI